MSAEKESAKTEPKEQWLTPDGTIIPTSFYGQLLYNQKHALTTNGSPPSRWDGALDAYTRGLIRLVICHQIPKKQVTAILGQQGLIDAMTSHLENLSDPVKPNNPNTPIERQVVDKWLAKHTTSE